MFGLFGSSLSRRRDKAAARARGALADYYAGTPLPADATPASELRLLAIDIETTGLDAATDTVLSVGFVPVDGDSLVLGGARHMVVHADREVGQSAVFHGLTDDMVAAGLPAADVLAATLQALTGRILLAHFAKIEVEFLSRACQQTFGAPFVPPVIDTLQLHDRLINRGFDDEAKGNELRLWNARERYGLPRYHAHEALTDAMACGELYLAQLAEFTTLKAQTFKTLRTD